MAYARQKAVDLLDRDDLDRLLAACGRSITATRSRALIAFLFFSGLRTAEALAVRPADVKLLDDGTVRVNIRNGKGGRQRIVTLAAPARPYLDAWLTARAERVTASRTAPLFCAHSKGCEGLPLDSGYARASLARIAARAGLGKRVHLHALRHAHASYLHHRGVPLAAIQVQLGHTSPLTTLSYLASIGAHDAHRHVVAAFADAA
jgi:integrase